MLDWIVEQGVRWQPSLGGTLSLGRTNSFFLGGGRAMLNALYLTAESLGVEIALRCGGRRSRDRGRHVPLGDTSRTAGKRTAVQAATLVAAAGGFEANIEWLKEYWGDAAENFLIRGTPYNRGTVLKMLLDKGVQEVGDPDPVPRRRDRRARAEIRRRHHHPSRLRRLRHRREQARASASTTRARTSGRSAMRSGGGSSRRSPTRSPTSSSTPPRSSCSCRRSIRRCRRAASRELAGKLGLDPTPLEADGARLQRRGAARHLRPHDARRLPHRRTDAAEEPLGAAHRDGAVLCLSGAPRHHLHLSRHAREHGGAHADERRPAAANMFAAGEIMAGNVLGRGYAAGIGMTIGSVFGRIAGREAARTCTANVKTTRGSRPADDGLQFLPLLRGAVRRLPGDGDAPLVRGRRPELPRQSLPRLRRLLRRLPVLAAARVQRQRAEDAGASRERIRTPPTRGRARSRGMFARNGLAISLVAALSVAAFILRLRGLQRSRRAVRHPYRSRAPSTS